MRQCYRVEISGLSRNSVTTFRHNIHAETLRIALPEKLFKVTVSEQDGKGYCEDLGDFLLDSYNSAFLVWLLPYLDLDDFVSMRSKAAQRNERLVKNGFYQ